MYGMKKLDQAIVRFIEYISWNKIDIVFTGNQSVSDWYRKRHKQKEFIEIYGSPKFIHSKDTSRDNQKLREIFKIPKKSLIFVLSGKVADGRMIPMICDVFRENDIKSHLVIIGINLADELVPILENTDNIHLVPFLENGIYMRLLKSADIGICLIENVCESYYFSLPQKILEYAFSGLNIISSDFPEMEKFVTVNFLGLSINNDYNSLYNAVTYFEESKPPKQYRDLKDYSWETQFNKIIEIYFNLMENK